MVCLEVEGALALKRSPALVKKEVVILVAVARQIGVGGLGCPVDVHPKTQADLSRSSWKSAQDGCGEGLGYLKGSAGRSGVGYPAAQGGSGSLEPPADVVQFGWAREIGG